MSDTFTFNIGDFTLPERPAAASTTLSERDAAMEELADMALPPDDAHLLQNIFLEFTTDDMSSDPGKRLHAEKQVEKYKELIPNLEGKIFSEHSTELYTYKPEDGHMETSTKTNFHVRRYEALSKNNDSRTYPFYYKKNTSIIEGVDQDLGSISLPELEIIDTEQEEKIRDFYLNWNFEDGIKENIYFSYIPSLHTTKHFPRHIKHSITLEPNSLLGLKLGQNFGQEGLLAEDGFNRVYDKMCIKYINKLSTPVDIDRFILSKNGTLSSMSSHLYPLESLFAKNENQWEPEPIETPELLHIREDTTGFTGENYTFWEDEKMVLSRMFSGLSTNWASANCVKKRIGLRTYREILDGISAPSEPLLYELVKKTQDGAKINSFFYPARLFHHSDGSTSALDFIDSQIEHNKNYEYVLKVHQIIYGTSYGFERNLNETQQGANVDIFKAFSLDLDFDIRILPIEIASWSSSISSRPGIPPAVTLIPQKKNSGMPKFFIETTFGQHKVDDPEQIYKPLNSQEYSVVNRLISEYSVVEEGSQHLLFNTKFQNKSYEIYRIDTEPHDLSDFEDSLIATVSPLHATVTGYAPAASFEDKIHPNKEYYYLFRAIDVWGTPSLTSGPYKYQILKDSEAFVTNFVSYNMTAPMPKSNVQMRKLIKITPSWKHLLIPDSQTIDSATSAFDAVTDEDGVSEQLKFFIKKKMTEDSDFWDKRYKIRITSKKTGRKIDIIFKPNLTIS